MTHLKQYSHWLLILGLLLILTSFIPIEVLASAKKESQKDLNKILLVSQLIAGFVVVASIIFAGIKLASSQDNPQNRTAGMIGLCFSFLGGYMVYKAPAILHMFF